MSDPSAAGRDCILISQGCLHHHQQPYQGREVGRDPDQRCVPGWQDVDLYHDRHRRERTANQQHCRLRQAVGHRSHNNQCPRPLRVINCRQLLRPPRKNLLRYRTPTMPIDDVRQVVAAIDDRPRHSGGGCTLNKQTPRRTAGASSLGNFATCPLPHAQEPEVMCVTTRAEAKDGGGSKRGSSLQTSSGSSYTNSRTD